MLSHHSTRLYPGAAGIAVGCRDAERTAALLGESHATTQAATALEAVVPCAVHQHGCRSERTHQRHFAGAFIAEYDTDAILVCIVDVMLLPVDGAVHIPQAVARLVIPCCFREGGKVDPDTVIFLPEQ